jgi:DNA-binding MarR family transcriptional regulator
MVNDLGNYMDMGSLHDGDVEGLSHRGDEPHLFREIFRTYQVLMAGFSQRVGMPAARFALMRLLAAAAGDVGVMELARRLGINAAAVTRQVQEMEAAGLVRRRAHPRDGRRTAVRLSAKGRRTFAGIHERTHELERALAAALGAAEMRAAAEVLARLRGFVERATK